ncbi:MAG: ABC transporter ATP-binding protein [Chloroflexi bacterium]|nr:ABC transporter ATP-binding protein [Chloroflexota bacterium]MBP8058835.1 ABC transporter ATP-binding protein [Chloroflexota bacterium]
MGFIMDGIDAEAYDRHYSDGQLIQRIGSYFKPQIARVGMISGLIIANSVMDMVLPILIARGVDQLALDRTASVLNIIILLVLGSTVLSWTFNFMRQRFTARTVGDVVLQLREDAFAAVMDRDMSFYDEFASGKIVSRVTSDTQDFANVVTLTLNLISQVLLVILIVSYLFSINSRLAWMALSIAPFVIAAALAFRTIARRTTQQAQRLLATVNATVQETISGISIAKNFRQEQTIYDEFLDVNEQAYQVQVRQGFVFSAIFPILVFIAGMGSAVIVYFGGTAALRSEISPGDWYLFVQAIALFWFPLTGIASFWSQFQLGLSSSERVFALIDAEARVVQTDNQPAPKLRGRIQFHNLQFRYTTQEQILQGFNLTIQAGETVALVGHTGAGKSSLGRLIARFYEYQDGQLLIDDHDIRRFDLVSYRRQLGIVPQVPFLFTGTVADNIRYAKPEASETEVRQVAETIGQGDWLETLPQGLETQVGEGGRGLSMGQRQLIALARVLLQNPAILILDEATASVDPLAEAQIQESLELVLKDRTAIIIAHRLSTIKNADRIIVLRQGEIIEEGSHASLMRQQGHYAELYDTYFRHQSAHYNPASETEPESSSQTAFSYA